MDCPEAVKVTLQMSEQTCKQNEKEKEEEEAADLFRSVPRRCYCCLFLGTVTRTLGCSWTLLFQMFC